MRRRLFRVARGAGAVLALGLAYTLWGTATGLWLPCPFHALTGLECPGCGVTRMCLSLLRLDWAGAWAANPGLLLLGPVMLALGCVRAVRYVRTGGRASRGEQRCAWVLAAALVGYGVLRNLM